jgi:hypothetical protein
MHLHFENSGVILLMNLELNKAFGAWCEGVIFQFLTGGKAREPKG